MNPGLGDLRPDGRYRAAVGTFDREQTTMDLTARIAWDRLDLAAAPAGPADPARCAAGLAELARVGIRVANPERITDAFVTTVDDLVAHERFRRGQRGTYTPLFPGFPDDLPAHDDVYLRALLGTVRLLEAELRDEVDSLVGSGAPSHLREELGTPVVELIDKAKGLDNLAVAEESLRAAFDFTDLGWWPASSVPQDVPATLAARARQDLLGADGHVEWHTVRLVDPAALTQAVRDWMADVLASPASLRPDIRDDLREAIAVHGVDHIDQATVTFRETRTLLTRVVWDTALDRVATLGLTPDDLLRLFAELASEQPRRPDSRLLLRSPGGQTVDINTGSQNQLRALFGPLVAWRVAAARPFASVHELQQVRGIGLGRLRLVQPSAQPTPLYPRLTRAQRRAVLTALERSDRLADVFRNRGLWLAVGKGLHVGAEGGPRTREVFTRLRQTRHDRTSTAARFEAALVVDLPAAVELAARQAPTVLARQVRRLAHLAVTTGPATPVESHENDECTSTVCTCQNELVRQLGAASQLGELTDAVVAAADQIPTRVALTARAQVADNGATYPRVAVTTSGHPMLVDRPVGHLALPEDARDQVVEALDRVVHTRLSRLESWAGRTVHLADGLDQVLLPQGQRSALAGLVEVDRGTRLPLGQAPTLRLFVHWKHPHSDLDLSVMALDEDCNLLEYVSWTNLRAGKVVHSGDITSAPAGAEEFIDIDLAWARAQESTGTPVTTCTCSTCAGTGTRARRTRRRHAQDEATPRKWRYLVPSIFRYSGPAFSALEEAAAGWMLRDHPSSDRMVFDPATVAGAFPLGGQARVATPFVVDLLTEQVITVDLCTRGSWQARVERDSDSLSTLVQAVLRRTDHAVSVADLVEANVRARGATIVPDPSAADITVGFGPDCTYDALHPARLLVELL